MAYCVNTAAQWGLISMFTTSTPLAGAGDSLLAGDVMLLKHPLEKKLNTDFFAILFSLRCQYVSLQEPH